MGLKDHLGVLHRRVRVIVISVLVVGLSALSVSLLQAPTYKGEARVVIGQQNAGATLLGASLPDQPQVPEQGIQTEVQLMGSDLFLRAVIDELNLDATVEELSERVSASEVGLTNLVVIQATAGSPEEAALIANALAQQYVDWSRDEQVVSIRAAANQVEASLQRNAETIANLTAAAEADPTGVKAQELATARSLHGTLTETLNQMRISESLVTGSGSLFESATPDPNKVSPQPLLSTALGLLVGLVVGVGVAFVSEVLDNSVVSAETAHELYGAPVLGRIPAEKSDDDASRRLAVVETPDGPVAESYRSLRNNLRYIDFEHTIKAILVGSAGPGEGKSTIAANLAAALSNAGLKVILVVCDFRKPTTEEFFGVTNDVGLSDVLSGLHDLDEVLQQPAGLPDLQILAAGPMPPNPSELLGSPNMGALVDTLKERASWVILDTPPILAVSDAAAVAQWTDGTLLVARSGKSKRDAACRAREDLERVGASLLGVVLVGVKNDSTSHGFYGYTPTTDR